ncbi:MAG: hypothetical protein RSB90_10480 [Eubacterium sp.]
MSEEIKALPEETEFVVGNYLIDIKRDDGKTERMMTFGSEMKVTKMGTSVILNLGCIDQMVEDKEQ